MIRARAVSPFFSFATRTRYANCLTPKWTIVKFTPAIGTEPKKSQAQQLHQKIQEREDKMNQSDNTYHNRLRFDITPEYIVEKTKELVENSKKVQDKVASLPENEKTFQNVVIPLANDEAEFSTLGSILTYPAYVHPEKSLREASSDAQKLIDEFEIASSMREDIFQALKVVKEKEYSQLQDEADKRILDRMLRDFERNGLGLEKEKREKVKALKNRLSKLCINFQQNLNEDKTELKFSENELEGLPDDFIENLKKDDQTGKRIVTLKYTDLFPVLKYCKVEETRKKLDFTNSRKCVVENTPLIEEAFQVRQEIAELMGFKTHAHYALDIRMAKTPENVIQFLNSLKDQLTESGKKELQNLLLMKEEEKKERGEEFDGKFNSWDFHYYHRLLKEKNYQVNDNEIKDYFPADVTFNRLLEISQNLLGLKFEKVTNIEPQLIWHEDVQYFNVYDVKNDGSCEPLGKFYLDLFPREGKYGHAAAFPLQCHHIYKNGEKGDISQKPISAMVCNFTKPTKTKPSLLKHDEVVTLWHEFGHLLHGFTSKAKYGRFSGTSVERDFVECPSQFMENFCWSKKALQQISSHHETGKPLPDNVIERMIAAKNVNVSLLTLRQLFFGIFDMYCHMNSEITTGNKLNSAAIYSKLREEISLISMIPDTNPSAGFSHLMGGYDAGYYGYLYSDVFSADIFGFFKEHGIFNPVVGDNYKKKILQVGGMRDGLDMLKDFLGREPNNEAFLRSIGLEPQAKQ